MLKTLLDLVRSMAERNPTRGYEFLNDGATASDSLSYADLDRACRGIAGAVQAANVGRGARALLLYEHGLEFVKAFWACAYAGIVAVPAPPPDTARPLRTVPRLRGIAADCAPELVLTDGHIATAALRDLLPALSRATVIDTARLASRADTWREPDIDGESVAVIQYTSGSTGAPRGVTVSHRNFLHNLDMLRVFHGSPEHCVMVHWLPLFHDMGLIRGMMSPLQMGGDCVMLPPMLFVQRPYRWLAAASRYGATSIGAPNFGYELCNRKISDAELEDLDLSSVRIAFCSAEPIRASTVARFTDRFSACGFARSAFRPSYGLAEATVMVCGETGEHGPQIRSCDRRALCANRVVGAPSGAADAVEIVSCGVPLGGQEVVTVNAAAERAGPDEIGEVWVRGPSVAGGYWSNPEATHATFGARLADGSGPYLRTGDLGWLGGDGELFVTSRSKDLIILRGQNIYAQDIESAAETVAGVRPGCVAAFSFDAELGESVAVVAELTVTADTASAGWPILVTAIRAAVGERFDVALGAVAFVERSTLPKTASGKVQRQRARADFLAGDLATRHVWRARERIDCERAPAAGRRAR